MDSDSANQPSKWPLEGYFSCGNGLVVSLQCLGQSFPARTESYSIAVTLPSLCDTDPGKPLRRPAYSFNANGEDPNGHEANSEWGVVGQPRKFADDPETKHAIVHQCVVTTEVEAHDEDSFFDSMVAVSEEVADWWSWIGDWITVTTGQDLTGSGKRPRDLLTNGGFHAWSGYPDGRRRVPIGWAHQFHTAPVGVLEPAQLQLAMDLVADDQCPETEWLFIRDARSLLQIGDYRRAVIDAGSAAELALTKLLQSRLAKVDPVIRETLLHRNRGLERRAVLARDLKAGTVPKTFAERLNRPRNRATHGGEPITKDEAMAAIDEATALVDQAFPLPEGLRCTEFARR
ncbi:hypothetical protein [Mycolicibacterium neoaurum]|uniref:hypothetical protein n=1 Tax=Mycolicibacterium neoaurum TaxID=1795 RepID=UPI001F4CC49A|nr:hypothetical protein [Mycolicibacterium neoaurum]